MAFAIGARSLRGDSLLLILLLISGDLRLFQVLMSAEDNFKSSSPVENKRHTNAHQPSPPSQQQRFESPLSAISSIEVCWLPRNKLLHNSRTSEPLELHISCTLFLTTSSH
jgi:hypothetical protein